MYSIPTYHRDNYDNIFVAGHNDLQEPLPEYCLVNAASFRLPVYNPATLLQEVTEEHRTNEHAAVRDFFRRIDDEKLEWRGADIGRGEVRLKTHTTGLMKNTGYLDLVVGEPVYCLPAVATLSAIHPSENFYEFRNKTYVHPITMSEYEHERFRLDVRSIRHDGGSAKTKTILGEILHRVYSNNPSEEEMDELSNYLAAQYPVGTIIGEGAYNHRRSNHLDDRQTVIPIGGVFVTLFNQIK